jgi:hypothetical protein
VALSISAHAAEVFSVSTSGSDFPTTSPANFLGSEYDVYGTTDAGNGSGWGGGVTTNFDGVTAVNPGDQFTAGSNTTTYFGPKFYGGLNRDAYQLQSGVIHSNGNGYRIRCNNVTDALINGTAQVGTAQVGTAQVGTAQVGEVGDEDYAPASADYAPASADYAPASADYEAATPGLGGVSPTARAVFMFDADTSTLSGEGDNLIFGDSDTLTAKLGVANNMGPGNGTGSINRASLATYRPMVKAGGEYYAGPLYTVDLTALSGANSTNFDITNTGASASWTLVSNMESSNNSVVGANNHPENLTVDSSATTVPGYTLTNITQVGFLLVVTAEINTGGFNYGVREFAVQATPANEPDPIEWSEDFTSTVSILENTDGLTGYGHAYTWYKTSGNATTPDPSTVTQDETNNKVVIAITENGNDGQAFLSMVGPGTTDINGQNGAARRVRPVSHETIWVFDLEGFKDGDADLVLQTRGGDGYIKQQVSPTGNIKFSTWMADYNHKNFDDFSGPSRLRVNGNNNNSGLEIETGGTFDGSGGATVSIDAPVDSNGVAIVGGVQATATVIMNGDNTAVERVEIVNQGGGYIADPGVTFAGGGMTVAPTFSFNYSSGNINGPVNYGGGTHSLYVDVAADILPNASGGKNWTLFADGQTLTYIQSYDSSDDSLSYYMSLTDKSTGEVTGPVLIATLNAADHSAGGHGFFDVTTGNRYTTPNNRDAVVIGYKRYTNADAVVSSIGVNSVSVVTSDDDRDGVVNRKDAFPADPFESADSDSDGVGDNSDTTAGYDDSVVAALDAAVQAAGSSTFSYYVSANEDDHSYSTGGGAITQEAYDAAVAAKDAAEAAEATAIADLAALPTLSQIQATLIDARVGSTMIEVSGGTADITMTLEETSDVSDWSNSTTSQKTFEVTAPAGTSFYRFKMAD